MPNGGRIYDFAFRILGGLDPNFARSFRESEQRIRHSNQTIRELQNALNQMEAAYRSGAISARTFAQNSAAIRNRINEETEALDRLTRQHEEYRDAQNAMSGFGGKFAGAATGLAAGLSIGAVLNEINAYQSAMGQAKAMTGAVGDVWNEMEGAIKGAYSAGFGADMQDVATAAGQLQQIIGAMNVDMQKATQHALLLRDTFGFEVTESARSAKVMMEQFGITEQQAYTLMAQGAQLGADKNGDLLDTLNEYSVQFKQMGFDAESFMDIIVAGAQSGVWSVDKIGDAIKEFGVRVKDGSKTTTEGFEMIGLDAEVMAQKFATGGESAQQAFQETIAALKAIEDPVQRNIAGVDLFGTMWEDMGEKAVFAMADAEAAVEMNGNTLDDIANNKMNNFNTAMAKLARSLEIYVVAPLAEKATPAINAFADFLGSVDPDILIAAIAGIGGAIAAFQVGSFIASLGSIAAVAATATTAIAAISWPIVLAAVVIGALIAAGVYLVANWDEITASAEALYNDVSAYFGELKDSVIEQINSLVSEAKALWEDLKNFLSHPIDGTINFVKKVLGDSEDVAENAEGGIYGKGAFLTTFAEESPEAAIPLDGSSRAIGLWQRAGEMLGVYPNSVESNSPSLWQRAGEALSSYPVMTTMNTNPTNINATFAPNITIQGNANEDTIRKLNDTLDKKFDEFKAMMARYNREQRRLSYG